MASLYGQTRAVVSRDASMEPFVSVASMIVWVAEIYAGIGLILGFVFILFGIDRVDASAHGAFAFRPLLLPGFALIWPLALARWRALSGRVPEIH